MNGEQELKVSVSSNVANNLLPGAASAAKVPKKTTKTSNFFVTINPNKVFVQGSDQAIAFTRRFKEVLDTRIFGNPIQFFDFKEGGPRDFKRFKIESTIEQGEETGRVHCHFIFYTLHNANVKLNPERLRKTVCEALGIENCHIHIKVFSSNEMNLLEYLNKGR